MSEQKTKRLIEKVLGIKYCPAFVYKRYVEHAEWNDCEEVYCCQFCPQKCSSPTCTAMPDWYHNCPEYYETLMLAMRWYKWGMKKERPKFSGYIWYSELVSLARR